MSLPEIYDRKASVDQTVSRKPEFKSNMKRVKGNGICVCFAMKSPFLKCKYCKIQEQSTPRMNIHDSKSPSIVKKRGKSNQKGKLVLLGGGAWKRISPERDDMSRNYTIRNIKQ